MTKQFVEARRLKGFQDQEPDVLAQRLHIIETVRKVAREACFQEISTPTLEFAEVLLGLGGETEKQLFRFTDNGGRDVAMRFDLTVPFARYVAERHGRLTLPFKRMQVGDVWRAEKPQKGRYREFSQCDLDILGSPSPFADIEIILCLHSALEKLIPMPFTISCGQRNLLSFLLENTVGLKVGQQEKILIVLDKLHKIGEEAVTKILVEELSFDRSRVATLLKVLTASQKDFGIFLSEFEQVFKTSLETKEVWEQQLCTMETLQSLTKGSHGKIVFDLSVVRGLAYYTGIVFETTVDGMSDFGSVCSGGRYDELCNRFLPVAYPGVGGSIGVDRLLALLLEHPTGLKPSVQRFFVAVASDQNFAYALTVVKVLRKLGLSVDLPMKWQKLSQQFKYADKMGATWVLTVGQEEEESETYALKDMVQGTEDKNLDFFSIEGELKKRGLV
ncbi:MAG: histidine--tRNA ligase [Oligoflexales bacterium]|nr:histidine--tRNA ligase [Oligoflexales bacterium]